MQYHRRGKDQEYMPCVELEDGTVIVDVRILLALVKALVKNGTVTVAEIKTELGL